MIYISPENEYPRHIGDIQLSNPTFKEGDVLPAGWIEVKQAPRPIVEADQIVYEAFPVEIDGLMTQNWVVREMTPEEIERRDAPKTVKAKLVELGLTEIEIQALIRGMVF